MATDHIPLTDAPRKSLSDAAILIISAHCKPRALRVQFSGQPLHFFRSLLHGHRSRDFADTERCKTWLIIQIRQNNDTLPSVLLLLRAVARNRLTVFGKPPQYDDQLHVIESESEAQELGDADSVSTIVGDTVCLRYRRYTESLSFADGRLFGKKKSVKHE